MVSRISLVALAGGWLALACGSGDPPNAGGGDDDGIGLNPDADASGSGDPRFPDAGEKLDLAGGLDDGLGGATDCPSAGGLPGMNRFSIIWIANTGEGTVSKIDTQTATELARYRTGPDAPDPSRTSVNLLGDVAVANRHGSVTKIASVVERCVDQDGDGTISTSTAAGDVLPWGDDECVLWHHDVAFDDVSGTNEGGPRAVAWDAGESGGRVGCDTSANLWVGWRDQPQARSLVRRLSGATGMILGEAEIPEWSGFWGHGIYGGAADAEGAFWGLGTLGTLIRVDPVTLEVDRWDDPQAHVMYGIALDAAGNPWLAGWDGDLWVFDRDAETFTDMGGTIDGPTRLRGLTIDRNGHAWIAGNEPCALVRFDTIAGVLVDAAIELPGCSEPVGVSIDVDGRVWVVDRGASTAFKVDPDTYAIQTVTGLVAPYTYSDMTGAGLDLVVNRPAG